jgi:5-methylcytosine-specific restriction endonuclease McrA
MIPASHGRRGRPWRRLRARILAESDVCWLCGKPGADSIDHVVPLSIDPSLAHDITNLRPAHLRCNSRRGNGTRSGQAMTPPMPRSRQW